jgi:8-oxo-dGTP diphosphatase
MAGWKSDNDQKGETSIKVKNFHIAIKAVIVNNGRALVLKEPNRFSGFDLPGGKIDEDENIEQALKRELNEELGLKKFKMGELLHVFERLDYHKNGTKLMLIYYKVEATFKKIKLSNEHTSYKWISKNDLIEIIKTKEFRNDGIRIALEKVLK